MKQTRDEFAAKGATIAFSFALSLSSVTLPFVAVAAGYDLVAVGVLTGISAGTQIVVRGGVGALMRRYPDWVLIVVSAVLLGLSTALLAFSTDWVPFIICQIAQGCARAGFWTGSQTHVVRGSGPATQALAGVNMVSTWAQLAGPFVAGVLAEWSLLSALITSTVFSLAAAVFCWYLDRLPPFAAKSKDRVSRWLWRRPGVTTGCWSGVTTGGWRGLMSSYVPVVLVGFYGESTTGFLIGVANAAILIGAWWIRNNRDGSVRRMYVISTVLCGVSTGVLALTADTIWVAALMLAIGGAAVGALQVIGPAFAVDAVLPDERGDAIVVTGTFRAAAMLGTPTLIAGLLGIIALGPSIAAVGVLMALPAFSGRGTT